MNISSNFKSFTENVIKKLRKLEYLKLKGEGYKVSPEVKTILIELPLLRSISIKFDLESLEYLLD